MANTIDSCFSPPLEDLQAEDGRKIRLRNTARMHRDLEGNVTYVEGIVEDVSRSRDSLGADRDAAQIQSPGCGRVAVLTVGRTGTANRTTSSCCSRRSPPIEGHQIPFNQRLWESLNSLGPRSRCCRHFPPRPPSL